jgi:LuxR family maltose regulon positive regulatory protein
MDGSRVRSGGRRALTRSDPAGALRTAPIARHTVRRPRLEERLDRAAQCAVTLVSAAAGSGKTLMLASWLAQRRPDEPVAWVTLRDTDDQVDTFWRTVAAAFAEVVPGPAGERLRSLAQSSLRRADPAPDEIHALLVFGTDSMTVVLDNLHEITDRELHHQLIGFAEKLPPNVHLVAATRHDPPWPIDRLRLAGVLEIVRMPELAFDLNEAADLFAQNEVELSGAQLSEVVTLTEGWAAGLRLAALGMRSSADPAEFLAEFSGKDRHVASYLLHEVFARQSEEWQRFILQISLVDEVCGDLADAITGGVDGQARLEQLAAANMFVIELGRSGWYRVHGMIADYLQMRSPDPALPAAVLTRAAHWFRARSLPWEAVRYSVAARQWSLVAELLGVHVVTLTTHQDPRKLDLLLSDVPREQLLTRPEIAMALAAARATQGIDHGIDELLDISRAGQDALTGSRQARVRLLIDAITGARRRVQGDLSGAVETFRRIPLTAAELSGSGLESWETLAVVALGGMGVCELWTGQLDAARVHLNAAVERAERRGTVMPRMNAVAHLALLNWICGDLNEAVDIAESAIAEFTRGNVPQAGQAASAYLALAGVALDRDTPAEADEWLELAQRAAIEPHALLLTAAFRLIRAELGGDVKSAVNEVRDAHRGLASPTIPSNLSDGVERIQAGLLDLAARDPKQLEERHHDAMRTRRSARNAATLFFRSSADGPANEANGNENQTRRERIEHAISVALSTDAERDEPKALTQLESALNEAAAVGLRRPFLDSGTVMAALLSGLIASGTPQLGFAVDLLERMNSAQHPRSNATWGALDLTNRERAVLRYMATALSNAEISAELFISVNTLKTHQRSIYRKLGVSGRRAAVRHGQERG